MAEISIWSAAIIVMLVMFAASIGFVSGRNPGRSTVRW